MTVYKLSGDSIRNVTEFIVALKGTNGFKSLILTKDYNIDKEVSCIDIEYTFESKMGLERLREILGALNQEGSCRLMLATLRRLRDYRRKHRWDL